MHGEYRIYMFGLIMTKNNNQYNYWNTREPNDHLLNEQIVYYIYDKYFDSHCDKIHFE